MLCIIFQELHNGLGWMSKHTLVFNNKAGTGLLHIERVMSPCYIFPPHWFNCPTKSNSSVQKSATACTEINPGFKMVYSSFILPSLLPEYRNLKWKQQHNHWSYTKISNSNINNEMCLLVPLASLSSSHSILCQTSVTSKRQLSRQHLAPACLQGP